MSFSVIALTFTVEPHRIMTVITITIIVIIMNIFIMSLLLAFLITSCFSVVDATMMK